MSRLPAIGRGPWWPLLVLLAAGCDLPGRPDPSDRPSAAGRAPSFEALYKENCSGCHGAGGKFGPAPPLNDPTFLAIVPDTVLSSVIAEGRTGTPMPAFARGQGGPLTDAEVKVLAEGLKPRWAPAKRPGDAPPPYVAGSPKGDETRGAKVFARACASCHGDRGEGTKDGPGAIHDRAFLELISDQALRRLVITGRPDLGMPDSSGKDGRPRDFRPLTSAEINDLVALLASWRRGGAAGGE